jgi:hypothetical protein
MEHQTIIEEFVPLKLVERDTQMTLTQDLGRACGRLFTSPHKPLVKALCVQIGYINMADASTLGVIRQNVDHDPLELFKASVNDSCRSRYDVLFIEDDTQCRLFSKPG